MTSWTRPDRDRRVTDQLGEARARCGVLQLVGHPLQVRSPIEAVLENLRFHLEVIVTRFESSRRGRAREARAPQEYLTYFEERSAEPARDRPKSRTAAGQFQVKSV
jgi:hypothetical protein